MRRAPAFALLAALAALAACGVKRDLKPRPGHDLPPPAYAQEKRPDAAHLLVPGPQERPSRSIELRTRSEPREDDPFDLPPQ